MVTRDQTGIVLFFFFIIFWIFFLISNWLTQVYHIKYQCKLHKKSYTDDSEVGTDCTLLCISISFYKAKLQYYSMLTMLYECFFHCTDQNESPPIWLKHAEHALNLYTYATLFFDCIAFSMRMNWKQLSACYVYNKLLHIHYIWQGAIILSSYHIHYSTKQ